MLTNYRSDIEKPGGRLYSLKFWQDDGLVEVISKFLLEAGWV